MNNGKYSIRVNDEKEDYSCNTLFSLHKRIFWKFLKKNVCLLFKTLKKMNPTRQSRDKYIKYFF